jgi:hypothetical protein
MFLSGEKYEERRDNHCGLAQLQNGGDSSRANMMLINMMLGLSNAKTPRQL